MQHPAPDDQLLLGYLLRELDRDQEAVVKAWLLEDESHQEQLNNLARLWQISSLRDIDEIDPEAEWSVFQSVINPSEQGNHSSPKHFRKMLLVAASLIVLIVFGWMIYQKDEKPGNIVAANSNTQPPKSDSIRFEFNTFLAERAFNLPDGSSVILYPGSSLYYNKFFPNNQRDISLTGKGRFKVFKDKKRPFTVHSGKISTTALGTNFTINAYPDSTFITVRLHEGRVVVRSALFPKHFYLKPGQELSFNKNDSNTRINTYTNSRGRSAAQAIDETIVITGDKGSWYMFNNQSLPDVFEQLKEMYKVDIIYEKADLQKMYFIGKFDKSESIENILAQISRLNNLSVSNVNGKFQVKK